MNKFYTIIFTLLACNVNAQEKKTAEAPQPAAIFVLTLDGKEYPINEGQEIKLDGSFNNPSAKVKMANYRKFDNGNISFNYKASATYDYEESNGNKTWTFSGNDYVVFLFELDGAVKLDALVANVVSRFGKKNCKVESVSKRVGSRMVSGKQINVTLAGQKLVQEYYEIELNDSKTNILAFQNTKKDDGGISADSEEGVEMVANSATFDKRH